MKIGYPCINTSITRETKSTFRLASYSEYCLIEVVRNNLDHLERILQYNVKKSLLFFRISSDLVPFASHAICKFNWQKYFEFRFKRLGDFIRKNNIRISMHPDQFVLINSPKKVVVENSVRELAYQCSILDLMCLDSSAKVQIHVGGAYGDKPLAMKNFEKNYSTLLSDNIKKRLVIENDDRLYNVNDCLRIHDRTGVPILFDSFHHGCCGNGDSLPRSNACQMCNQTWRKNDGVPMVDYSEQAPGYRKGKHSVTIDLDNFTMFIMETRELNYDLMLEVKDKQISAIKASNVLCGLGMSIVP
jgi:UV DNA damage endonuclease